MHTTPPQSASASNALLDRGFSLMQAGDFEGAVACLRQMLAIQPDSILARAAFGRCLGRIGLREEAISALIEAGRALARTLRKPGQVNALLDVAQELQINQAHAAALALIDKSLKASPSMARAHHMRSQALERLHDGPGARQAANRAHILAPGEANAAIQLATLEARWGDPARARSLLETCLNSAQGPARQRALLELGRLLDRLGEHHAAFAQLTEAGRLGLATPEAARYDLSAIYQELAAESERCTPDWIAANRHDGEDSGPEPIFLLGFYRSGTTLLEQILAAHPAIRSSDEADLMSHVSRTLFRWQPDPQLHWTERFEALGPQAADRLRAAYRQRAKDCLGGLDNRILLDKTALNTINLGLIRAVFPRARIVFALRDPRDVLLSCFMQAFTPNPLTAQFLDWSAGARFYGAVMDHWRTMGPVVQAPVTVVRYEQLVADPRGALAPVLEALGLEWHADQNRFYDKALERSVSTPSYAEVARPLYASSVARWRAYSPHFQAVRQDLEPHVEAFGYGPWV